MCLITWESSPLEFEQASIDVIIQRFNEAQPVSKHNMNVRRLSETVVAKRVSFDSKREYDNQVLAWSLLDSEQLRVPEPIRYIEHSSEYSTLDGYIIMEYLHGTSLEECNVETSVDAIAGAILQISTRTCYREQSLPLGPPTGGCADGFPWGQNGAEIEFKTKTDIQDCANKRLSHYAQNKKLELSEWRLDLRRSDCGLCHLDLAPRNILILEDGNIGIVDWSTLAYYPVVFELASLWHLRNIAWTKHISIFNPLISKLERSTGASQEDSIKLEIVQSQSTQFFL